VQLFTAARDAAGSETVDVELADATTVGDLRRALAEQLPALTPLVPLMMFAVDADYADDRTVLHEGADVAAIPPVSGR
jgi:molybdopterin converting factor small subunit